METRVEFLDSHIRVTLAGRPDFAELLSFIDTGQHETQQARAKRLLVDVTPLDAISPLAVQAILGEHIAMRLAHIPRIACIVREEVRTGNVEKVARSNGANMRTFSTEAEGMAWLMQD